MNDRSGPRRASPLVAFVRDNVLGTEEREGEPPAAATCRRVARIAPISPAAGLGVRTGDLLAAVDDRPAASVERPLWLDGAEERRLRVWSVGRGTWIEMHTTGIPPGLDLPRTPEAIVRAWDPLEGDVHDLLRLWEVGAWEALRGLAWMRCHDTRSPPGLLARFQGLQVRDTPALCLLGAALYEQGRTRRGLELLTEYGTEYADAHDPRFKAISLYYAALHTLDRGHRPRAAIVLRQSLEIHAFDRVLERYRAISDTPAPPSGPEWPGLPFPHAYSLPPVDASPGEVQVSLEAALDDLAPGQLLLIAVLGYDRGGRAYEELMGRYLAVQAWFEPFVAGLHVITSLPERDIANPRFYESEDLARSLGLPCQVLLDEYDQLPPSLGLVQEALPDLFLVDRTGTVLHEGELDDVDLWNALDAAA